MADVDASARPVHLVVLGGRVGSGKSSLARAAVATWPGTWRRCSQDALGSRRAVERAAREGAAQHPDRQLVADHHALVPGGDVGRVRLAVTLARGEPTSARDRRQRGRERVVEGLHDEPDDGAVGEVDARREPRLERRQLARQLGEQLGPARRAAGARGREQGREQTHRVGAAAVAHVFDVRVRVEV